MVLRPLRAAVLELSARWEATDRSLEEVDDLLTHGGATDLVVLPELSFTGYVSADLKFDLRNQAEPLDGPTIKHSQVLARKHKTHLVVPLVLAESGRLYNASIVVGPAGEIVAIYRKRHPWFPERWATPGENAMPLFDLPGGYRATIAICYDGHFIAQDSPGILASADILIFPSAWVDDEDSRLPLLHELARTFDLTILNANWGQGGHVDIPGQGHSVIVNCDGIQAEVLPPQKRAVTTILNKKKH